MAAKRKQPIYITRIQYGNKRNKQTVALGEEFTQPILNDSKVEAAEKAILRVGQRMGWVTFSDGSIYRVTYHGCYQVAKAEVAK